MDAFEVLILVAIMAACASAGFICGVFSVVGAA